MNEWSKESLKEMFGDNVIEKLAFLSGCTKHSYCDPSHRNLDGYIVSYEKLEKFAELIAAEEREACALLCEQVTAAWSEMYNEGCMDCSEAIRARGGV